MTRHRRTAMVNFLGRLLDNLESDPVRLSRMIMENEPDSANGEDSEAWIMDDSDEEEYHENDRERLSSITPPSTITSTESSNIDRTNNVAQESQDASADEFPTEYNAFIDDDAYSEEENENYGEVMINDGSSTMTMVITINDAVLDWDFDTLQNSELSSRFRTLVERIQEITIANWNAADSDKVKATPAQLNLLPKLLFSRYAASTAPKLENHDNCSICLSEFRALSQVTPLPCRHVFHESCIKQWVKDEAICPNCKGSIDWTKINDVKSSLLPLRRGSRKRKRNADSFSSKPPSNSTCK
jgi:hypothetical protein